METVLSSPSPSLSLLERERESKKALSLVIPVESLPLSIPLSLSLSLSVCSKNLPTQRNPWSSQFWDVSREERRSAARLKKPGYGQSQEHCELDELAAETTATMTANHPDYASLAARIAISNLHKNTKKSFSETIKDMYNHFNKRSRQKAPLIANDV